MIVVHCLNSTIKRWKSVNKLLKNLMELKTFCQKIPIKFFQLIIDRV